MCGLPQDMNLYNGSRSASCIRNYDSRYGTQGMGHCYGMMFSLFTLAGNSFALVLEIWLLLYAT